VRYLVAKMSGSEKIILEAMNKLTERFDSYDKRITTLGSNLAKVQSQVDLSLCSIEVVLKEQIVLLEVANSSDGTSLLKAIDSTVVMGPLPTSSVQPTLGDSHTPDLSPIPSASESPGGMSGSDHRCPWMC
jgi:hypothetical protein